MPEKTEALAIDPQLLPWHRVPWEQLQRAIESQRLSHALLFVGPDGVGKRLFAAHLARSLLCEHRSADGQPCDNCRACHLSRAGTHPDFHAVKPEETSKSGEIRIDAIRELIETEALTAGAGGFKLVVVSPADRMNTPAANSLLKTLEEPTRRTLIILITAEAARLPATVRSRCQTLVFRRPSREMAGAWLARKTENADIGLLLDLAGDAPLQALRLAGDPVLQERATLITEFLGVLAQRNDPIRVAERWLGLDLTVILNWLVGWLIDLILLRSASGSRLRNSDRRNEFQPIAQRLDPRQLHRMLDEAYAAKRALGTTLNPQLTVERLLIQWGNAGLQIDRGRCV